MPLLGAVSSPLGVMVVVTVVMGGTANCPKFKDIAEKEIVRCGEECLNDDIPVYGTLLYGEDSDVCMSGLHAGALNSSGGILATVRLAPDSSSGTGVVIHGTCKNGVCSKNNSKASGPLYKVKEAETILNDTPSVNLTCQAEDPNVVTCSASLEEDCRHHDGPELELVFTLMSYFECNKSSLLMEGRETLHSFLTKEADHSSEGGVVVIKHTFVGLLPGQRYEPSVQLRGVAFSENATAREGVVTRSMVPPPAKNLRLVPSYNHQMKRLLWDDPCPSNGELTKYKVIFDGRVFDDLKRNDVNCKPYLYRPSSHLERCLEVWQVIPGLQYNASVWIGTTSDWSEPANVSLVLDESKPSKPEIARKSRDENSLDVTVRAPENHGGILVNCTMTGPSESPCVWPYEERKPMECGFDNLLPGKLYKFEAFCCNAKLCGEIQEQDLGTVPQPKFDGPPAFYDLTDTTVQLSLPDLVDTRDGTRDIVVVVEREEEGQVNRTENIKDRVEEAIRNMVRQREKDRLTFQIYGMPPTNTHNLQCTDNPYIAGRFSDVDRRIRLGTNYFYQGFHDCPLQYNDTYFLSFMGISELQGAQKMVWYEMNEPWQMVVKSQGFAILIFLMLFLGLLMVVFVWPFVCSKDHKRSKLEEEEDNELMVRYGLVTRRSDD